MIGVDKQEKLESKLEQDIARCFEKYFQSKGRSIKHVDVNRVLKGAVNIGALNYADSNIELAAYLANRSVGYLKCFWKLKKLG